MLIMPTQEPKSELHKNIEVEVSRQKETMVKSLTKAIDTMHTSIMVNNSDLLSKITERDFLTHFLPYLTGLKEDTDGRAITNWIALARSISAEVIVTSDRGEELFRVPPILDTSGILFKGKLTQVMAKYAAYGNHPMYNADRYLDENLNKAAVNNSKREFKNSWVDILRRYDLLDQFMVKEEQDTKTTIKQSEDSDFLDYD